MDYFHRNNLIALKDWIILFPNFWESRLNWRLTLTLQNALPRRRMPEYCLRENVSWKNAVIMLYYVMLSLCSQKSV